MDVKSLVGKQQGQSVQDDWARLLHPDFKFFAPVQKGLSQSTGENRPGDALTGPGRNARIQMSGGNARAIMLEQ